MNMKHRFTTIKLLKSGLDNNNKSARRGLGPSKRQQVVVDYYSSSSTMNGLRHLSQVFYYIYFIIFFLIPYCLGLVFKNWPFVFFMLVH